MQGLSSELFTQQLRQELAMQQVLSGVTSTALAPAGTAKLSLDVILERHEVQLQRFDPAAYRTRVSPTDADIEAFYKANDALFRAPEQATIEYVMLDLATLGAGVAVPAEDLSKYYSENASRYTATEERRASHILTRPKPAYRPPTARPPRTAPRPCWPRCARRPPRLRNWRARTPTIRARLPTAATWSSLVAVPWSSRSTMPRSR